MSDFWSYFVGGLVGLNLGFWANEFINRRLISAQRDLLKVKDRSYGSLECYVVFLEGVIERMGFKLQNRWTPQQIVNEDDWERIAALLRGDDK